MSDLHRRAERVASRAVVHAWEYRQRNHAKGVWSRLRRVLADAKELCVISDEAAQRLVAAGLAPEPVGLEIEPPIRLFVISPDQRSLVPDATPIRVGLAADLLRARNVALMPFADSVLGSRGAERAPAPVAT